MNINQTNHTNTARDAINQRPTWWHVAESDRSTDNMNINQASHPIFLPPVYPECEKASGDLGH